MRKRNTFALFLGFSAFHNLTVNLVHPVTPTLLTELGQPDYLFGVLFAAMSAGQLVSSTFWGRFSDRYGRRPAIIIGCLGYLPAQLLFLYGRSALLLVAARFIGGATATGMVVGLMAGAVDLSTPENRAMRLSSFAATVAVSASAGYFVGGLAGAGSVARAFWLQTAMLAAFAVLVWFFYAETLDEKAEPLHRNHSLASLKNALSMLTPILCLYLACVSLSALGTYGYDNAFNYFIKRELGFPASDNGVIKAVTGLLGFVGTVLFNRQLLKRMTPARALTLVLCLCAGTLTLSTGLSRVVPAFIAANVVFYLFNAMYQPIAQSLMTATGIEDVGLLAGLFTSAKSVGMIGGSLAAGFLYTVSPLAPFIMQIACFLLAALCVALFARRAPQ